MLGPVFLRGDRVALRPVEEADLEFCQRNHNEPAVRMSMPRVHPQERDATRGAYLEGPESGVGLLLCADGGDGDGTAERLGFCALFALDADSGRAEVGAWLAPEAEGQGYATEGVSLLVDYAFAERRLHRLNAGRLTTNERSSALLERLGFREEGRRRDYYFVDGDHVDRVEYGLLRGEWDGDGDGN